jgi:transglutaminase-like putative cysteine protease
VHLNDIAADTLFIAGNPQQISVNLPMLTLTRGGAYQVPLRFSSGGLNYGVYSFLEDESATVAGLPEPLPSALRKEFLDLPALDERIPRLAREMAAGARNEQEKARQIEYRLRRDYGYTLQLLPAAVADPLAQFLFVRKKGHCEYFASAMAVMLRTLGIPSRVVTGFQSGVYNPMTGWQVVRASDAHSWVEAWITGRGWITFDPTPADPGGAVAGMATRLALFADAADQFWQDWVLSYDLERQIVLAARMDESARQFRFQWLRSAVNKLKEATQASAVYLPWLAVVLGIGVAAMLFGPAFGRWCSGRLRVRRLVRGEGRASDATLLYQRMLRALERRGIQKPPWLTPAEFVRVLPPSDFAPLVNDLTGAYNEFRFGGRRDVAPRMVQLLDQLEKM